MINIRKLAAIDIAFLGSRIIIGEFLLGVIGPAALGIFIALRAHSAFQWAMGINFLAMGLNYVPLLVYAVSLTRSGDARALMADEIESGKREAMRKYRRGSLLLLLPFVIPVLALLQRNRANAGRSAHVT